MKKMPSQTKWTKLLTSLIDGIETHLPASAPASARRQLANFKLQLPRANTLKAKKKLEREIDAFAESTPQLRSAVDRYLAPQIKKTVTEARVALEQANILLRQNSKNKV